MRRFRFRLDPLLRLRSQLERASRRELARATAALHEVDQQLTAAAHGRREFSEAAARSGLGETLASALAAGLSRHEFQLLTRQRQMAAQLEAVRTDYVQKKRELGALEQWREREHEDWRADSQRAEQAELDELAQLIREGKK